MADSDFNAIPSKRCSKCKAEYPATTEYFARAKNRRDGLYQQCRPCHRASKNKDYRKHIEARRAAAREWHHANRDEIRRRDGERYSANPEKARRQSREYHARHRDLFNERQRAARAQNPQAHRSEVSQWRRTHPELAKQASHRRLLRQKQAAAKGVKYPQRERSRLYLVQHGTWYYCQKHVELSDCEIDHVIPISRGGTNEPDNLVLACSLCNARKHDKLPHEWSEGGRLL